MPAVKRRRLRPSIVGRRALVVARDGQGETATAMGVVVHERRLFRSAALGNRCAVMIDVGGDTVIPAYWHELRLLEDLPR